MVTTNGNLATLPLPPLVLKKGERLADEAEIEMLSRFQYLKDQCDMMEQERKELGEQLKASINADAVRWQGGSAKVVTVSERKSFDLDAFTKAHPEWKDEIEKFMKAVDAYSYVRLGR